MKLTGQSKRDIILKTAENIFLKRGFFPTKVDEIAQEAGVAKGTVYLYFPDKESIYLALLEKKVSEGNEFLREMIKKQLSAREKLSQIFDRWFFALAKSEGLPGFASLENINITSKIIKKLKKRITPQVNLMIDLLSRIIKEGIRKKEFKELDSRVAALCFLDLLHSGVKLMMFTGQLKGKEKSIKEIFFRGLER